MMSYGSLLQSALLAGFVLAITLSLLVVACERPLSRLLSRQAPRQRVRILWWVLTAPVLLGMAYALVAIVMPSVFHSSATFAAACSAHSYNLLHVCVWHPNENGQSGLLWGAIALLAGYATWLIARAVIGVWHARRTLLTMLRLSRRLGPTDRLHVVDVDQPMAFACSVGAGHVLLSQSLLDRLSPTQLQVVLAHEQAHLEHRDAFWRLMAGMLSGIQLPGTRRRLLRDYELALEQRCDFIAAASVGCQITVAETLVAVKKIYHHHALAGMPLSMAFLSDFVPERVQALLSPGRRSNSYLGLFLGFTVLAFCSMSTGWLHYLTESLITMLAG